MPKNAAPMTPLSIRLPAHTRRQLDALCAHLGMSIAQVLILALDRLAQQELLAGVSHTAQAEPQTD